MRKYTLIALLFPFLPLLSIGQTSLTLGITGHDARCGGNNDGSAVVTATGGVAPYSYLWSPTGGATDSAGGLAAGVYSVTVTDNAGHTASSSITIHQPAPLTVWIDSIVVPPCDRTTDDAICGCANTLWAVVSGGTAPYAYLWSPGGYTTDTLFKACYLDFTVDVIDANNCASSDSLNVVIPGPILFVTGIAQLNSAPGMHFYPNPATDQLTISIAPSAPSISNIAIYDMMGRKVMEQPPAGNDRLITLDVSRLACGNYLLKTSDSQGQQVNHFVVSR